MVGNVKAVGYYIYTRLFYKASFCVRLRDAERESGRGLGAESANEKNRAQPPGEINLFK